MWNRFWDASSEEQFVFGFGVIVVSAMVLVFTYRTVELFAPQQTKECTHVGTTVGD